MPIAASLSQATDAVAIFLCPALVMLCANVGIWLT